MLGGPARLAATVGMMGAGMVFGGAFATGVLFGAGTVGAAMLARRAMKDRSGWSNAGASTTMGAGDPGPRTASEVLDAGTPLAGDSGLA